MQCGESLRLRRFQKWARRSAAIEVPGINGYEAKRQNAVRLAQTDRELNAEALRDRAVAALGGVAYAAIPPTTQPANSSLDERVIGRCCDLM